MIESNMSALSTCQVANEAHRMKIEQIIAFLEWNSVESIQFRVPELPGCCFQCKHRRNHIIIECIVSIRIIGIR